MGHNKKRILERNRSLNFIVLGNLVEIYRKVKRKGTSDFFRHT